MVENKKQVVNAISSVSSWYFAAAVNKRGNTFADRTNARTNKAIPLKNEVTRLAAVIPPELDNAESKKITTISCINNNPSARRPCNVSIWSLSENIFTTTDVLLNATMKPMIVAVVLSIPNCSAINKARKKVIAICIIVPNEEKNPTSFNFLRSISRPTKNSKNAIPISDKAKIISWF